MIIWGTRGFPSVVEEREFYCPRCDARMALVKVVRTYFTLYFIPIFPIGSRGRYIECKSCAGTYEESVLEFRPVDADDHHAEKILRVMILAALADSKIDVNERMAIERQYSQLAGVPLVQGTIEREAELARQSGVDLNRFLLSFVHELSDFGKELVVKVAYGVMASSGQLQAGHKEQLSRMANTLKLEKQTFLGILKQASRTV